MSREIHIVKYKLGNAYKYSLKTEYYYARMNWKYTFDSICELCECLKHPEFMWNEYLIDAEDEVIIDTFLELEDIRDKYLEYFV